MVIRFIQLPDNSSRDLECYVERDDERHYQLVIDHPGFYTKFSVNWIDTEEQVDWLAGIVSKDLCDTYRKGKKDKQKQIEYLFNSLFKEIHNE